MIYHETEHGTLYCGDSLDALKGLANNSVDCCITSPPYWGLRDYGCNGQLGLEKSPEEYVANMVQLFREVRRVLKADGVLWLNLGDSYNGSGGAGGDYNAGGIKEGQPKYNGRNIGSLKPKDLVGIPWRVAFALQADGWWLRQDIIWHKPNPMPESVRDRCTKSHEYIFMLTKSARYYFDSDAIKEPAADSSKARLAQNVSEQKGSERVPFKTNGSMKAVGGYYRNKRSVWTVTTKPYKEAHFATYPPDLILPCVKAAKADAVILDPFFGSGTTGLVAVQNGRRYIGIDLNPKYCEIAARRIENELDQTTIDL